MEEEIKQVLEVQKQLLKAVIEDDEIRALSAKGAKLALDDYIEAGFSRSEALQLVAASMSKSSN